MQVAVQLPGKGTCDYWIAFIIAHFSGQFTGGEITGDYSANYVKI